MMQLTKQEQLAKFQPFLKTSIFLTLEITLICVNYDRAKCFMIP